MNDLISRADLINYLDICINDTNGKPPLTDAVLIAIKCAVELIPSVDAETIVHGHWIWGEVLLNRQTCSCCKAHFDCLEIDNYCPNCGAKMDEVSK